ncbi:MAG: imidazolonepropionase [Candidatus Bipolaricaulaceae bacterium]
MDLVVTGIGELATLQGSAARAGRYMGEVTRRRGAYLVVEDGRVAEVGQGTPPPGGPRLDVGGRAVTAGLVDPHTHAVFAAERAAEFYARAQGAPYTGGGILATVAAVRAASEDQLVALARPRLERMLRAGTTTVEVKSGYALSTEGELKLLRAIRRLGEELPLTVVPTFLGAHAVPPEVPRADYLRRLVEEMIPRVAAEGLARFCDVFCDQGFYTVEEARQVLAAGQAAGLPAKLHADELAAVGGAELAAELGAVSADHLLRTTPAGAAAMAAAGVVGVLLPGTAFVLGASYPPARAFLDAGLPLALATDFNPGSSPLSSLPLVMSLAALRLGLTPAEILCAVTLNAAAAVGMADQLGTLEVGKWADLAVWDVPTFAEVPYWIGQPLAWAVVKRGQVVWRDCGSWPTPS